jgi:hypothetical protein
VTEGTNQRARELCCDCDREASGSVNGSETCADCAAQALAEFERTKPNPKHWNKVHPEDEEDY